MLFNVLVTETAVDDFNEIFDYLSGETSENITQNIFNKLKKTLLSLEQFPQRGHEPPELYKKNLDFLEIHSDYYRIFYLVLGNSVNIVSILDGRRNVREILINRIEEGKM